MKALSIRQPWAWAICYGDKRVENRDWYCSYRGPILIHASKLPERKRHAPEDFIDAMDDIRSAMRLPQTWRGPLSYRIMQETLSGGIVGRAKIVDCFGAKDALHPCRKSPWYTGAFGIVLSDVEPLPLVRCKGALGLWDVPDDVMAKIESRTPAGEGG